MFDYSDSGDYRTSQWEAKEVERGGRSRDIRRCLPGPHFSHLTVIVTLGHWISGIPLSLRAEISGLLFKRFLSFLLSGPWGVCGDGSLIRGRALDWFGKGDQNQLIASRVWLLVVTRVHSCRMLSVLFWSITRGGKKLLNNCEFCQSSKLWSLTWTVTPFKGKADCTLYLVTKWCQARDGI